ncbi:HNH endonuclease [Sphingomonas sp. CFBP 13706]|uniref:HNH endonuclease n=1 Tax=Sphingomonas sp. CFBP 13706 TaxID=2775314 RepID=UPI0017853EE0|nr:HNH endonuclease signature motif containing protein [Sphingomonas sp. CFBP 13706]MBD8736257.1 HNH endonuclease [Sphingomonas sp. CFBP 13706]
MTRYILKPILWNALGYRRPGGYRATSGYPSDTGYGHEEWNNSDALGFVHAGAQWRAFHTEGIGDLTPDSDCVVLLYASHDGLQQLVGIVGGARYLGRDESRAERLGLVDRLQLDGLSADAWSVDLVRTRYRDDQAAFMADWSNDLHWIPNWRCSAETFLWLDDPVTLDARELRGTKKLLTMFGRHTELTAKEAAAFIDCVPESGRLPAWHRIRALVTDADGGERTQDLKALSRRKDLTTTTRTRLVDARLGQGRYRTDLERRWDGRCAVTGCAVREVLRASHVKAWRPSNDRERLDAANGLLLSADIDALFDRGLASFADDGRMLLSERLTAADRDVLRVPSPLRRALTADEVPYMAVHRQRFGFGR